MRIALDLTKRHFTRKRGGLAIIGTWFRNEDGWRPCLVLIRDGEDYSEFTVPCIVPADQVWVWSEDIGDPQFAARQAHQFCRALRIDEGPEGVFLIAGIIHDHLGDLMGIPPFSGAERVVADGLITDGASGRTTEVVLTDV